MQVFLVQYIPPQKAGLKDPTILLMDEHSLLSLPVTLNK